MEPSFMILERCFEVPVSRAGAWQTLTDLETVAR